MSCNEVLFEVSNFDKSKEINEEHPLNSDRIFVTDLVLKLPKYIFFNF